MWMVEFTSGDPLLAAVEQGEGGGGGGECAREGPRRHRRAVRGDTGDAAAGLRSPTAQRPTSRSTPRAVASRAQTPVPPAGAPR